jgi:hypothetical protein
VAAVKTFDPIRAWFLSLQESGEFIGIRFGRIAPGASQPEWTYLPHSEVDGIGGFAQILRQGGVSLPRLPRIKHPSRPSRFAILVNLAKFLRPRHRLKWKGIEGPSEAGHYVSVPSAVAWHTFDQSQTTQLRRVCRQASITVNSFLLKHLAHAIGPCLEDRGATIPWMIPVNMRGQINRACDLENHSSYIPVAVQSRDTAQDVHRRVYAGLQRGDHWANWYSYESSLVLSAGLRRFLIKIEKCTPEWNIGSFSNLGDWDPECRISHPELAGTWLFAPPVLRCQPLGTGCVTFQNRLSLVIQAHPELTVNPADTKRWLDNWVKEIQFDLASLPGEAVASTADTVARLHPARG